MMSLPSCPMLKATAAEGLQGLVGESALQAARMVRAWLLRFSLRRIPENTACALRIAPLQARMTAIMSSRSTAYLWCPASAAMWSLIPLQLLRGHARHQGW